MNRFGAFAVHLGISLIIFVILGYVILYHWYPDFFFASDGGWQGIRIVAFVDLVLGPTLTLVVFNRSKPRKELQRDLSIIGVVQLGCLMAGTYVVYSERPVAMVYADGSFQSMTADDYRSAGVSVPEFHSWSPAWMSVVLPEDPTAQGEIRKRLLIKGQPLKTAAEYYVPFETSQIDTAREGLSDLEMDRVGRAFFERFAQAHGGTIDDYLFLPFGTRYAPAVMAMRLDDSQLFYLELPVERADEDDPG
jgi:hypothetical protein